MKHRAYPERITQARELFGLTKSELADSLEVSVAAVAQWESGAKHPLPEHLAAMSRRLEVPMTLFFKAKPAGLERKGPLSFRSWKSASTRKANRKAERLAEMTAEIYSWLGEKIDLPASVLPDIPDQGSQVNVEVAARETRKFWGLGDRPLLKFSELLESKGIFLNPASFGDERFDAFSCVIDGRPFIFLGNEKKDRARSRFDAAHELGHLVLHQHLGVSDLLEPEVYDWAERQADQFASAFLLPQGTFGDDVKDTTLNGFLNLKPKWGVSVQCMVVRSTELGLITPTHYGDLFKQMGWRRWRRPQGEPLDDLVPTIAGAFGRKSLGVLVKAGYVQAWEVPSLLQLPLSVVGSVLALSEEDLKTPEPELKKIVPFDHEPSLSRAKTEYPKRPEDGSIIRDERVDDCT